MKNIFLEIEYEGTNYFGFQIQNKKQKQEQTVQAVLEKALERLFNQSLRLTYTGRTDRGVHACAQGANFKVDTRIPLKNIKEALNSFLPSDVRVKKVKRVPLDFHCRFWAKSKVYRYIISLKKEVPVFERNFCWHIPQSLNLEKMREVSQKIVGKRDYSLFAKEVKRYKDCVRQIKSIIFRKRESFLYIDIEADGFLRGMARNIVSFLVRVGEGKLSLEQASSILQYKAPYSKRSAPACGLYLFKVKYR
ncbi:MAG: tRNA pseudouridine(38-40) synthase TruA [Candidatus Omnitrophota bacterium]|nr:MAG: tRNA pseudouridine(38-40) synthase TruA [Candidatus Omnitrophota bacterium]